MAHEKLKLPAGTIGRSWPLTYPFAKRSLHRHDELEFNLVSAGSGRYVLQQRTYDLFPGSLVWLFPNQDHVLVDCDNRFRMWIAVIKRAPLERLCQRGRYRVLRARDPGGNFCRTLGQADARGLQTLLREAHQESDDPPLHDAALSHALLKAWSGFLRAGETAPRALHPCVARALDLCRRDPAQASLEELARACNLSRTYLSRLFKQQLGVGLNEYRNRCRLEKFFRHRQTNAHESLLAAALQAGFGSYAQFHRVCKAQTGRSPHQLDASGEKPRG